MKYQIFYLSSGCVYPLSELDNEKFDHEFDSLEEASDCFRGWVSTGLVNYPKVTFIILPVIK